MIILPGFHINCLLRLFDKFPSFFRFNACRITISSKRENNEICSLRSNSLVFDKFEILYSSSVGYKNNFKDKNKQKKAFRCQTSTTCCKTSKFE